MYDDDIAIMKNQLSLANSFPLCWHVGAVNFLHAATV